MAKEFIQIEDIYERILSRYFIFRFCEIFLVWTFYVSDTVISVTLPVYLIE